MNLESISQSLAQQQADLTALRSDVAYCHDVHAALVDCLSAAGTLRAPAYLAAMHRRHFQAACAAHFFQAEAQADTVFATGEIALTLGLCAGPSALRRISSTCLTISGAARAIWPKFRDLCISHIYVCGGTPDGRRMLAGAERFSSQTMSWEPLPPMSQRRGSASVGILAGQLYVCGGCSDEGQAVRSAERFNLCMLPAAGDALNDVDPLMLPCWEELPPMSSAREGASAGAMGGRLYICGGWDDSNQTLRSCECFCPEVGMWEQMPPMAERRARPAAGVLLGRIYVCGGSDRDRRLNSVESLGSLEEEDMQIWRTTPPMLQTRFAAAAAAVDGRLFVCGGWGGSLQARKSVEFYDATAEAWEFAQPMLAGRPGAVASAAAGYLYVLGGYCSELHVDSVERLDAAAAGRGALPGWVSLPSMGKRRSFAAAAAMIC